MGKSKTSEFEALLKLVIQDTPYELGRSKIAREIFPDGITSLARGVYLKELIMSSIQSLRSSPREYSICQGLFIDGYSRRELMRQLFISESQYTRVKNVAIRRLRISMSGAIEEVRHPKGVSVYTITKKFSFSGSHHLPLLPEDHKCRREHGHNWTVVFELESAHLDPYGFVVDYGELGAIRVWIDEVLDHRNINEVLGGDLNPTTAEHLAEYLFEKFALQYPQLVAVTVCETENTSATYREPRIGLQPLSMTSLFEESPIGEIR